MILALVVGPRTPASADTLIGRTAAVLVGRLPLFASDGLDQYGVALVTRWPVDGPYPRTGRRGRPRHPAQLAHPERRYVQLVKQREGRRLVSVSRRVIHGHPADIDPGQSTTSLVERLNLTLRQANAPLARKTLAFAKDEGELRAPLALQGAASHFARPHLSLRRRVSRPAPVRGKTRRRWAKRTPAMAAGITDRVGSLHELLKYRAAKHVK